jgi:hypothetical protein
MKMAVAPCSLVVYRRFRDTFASITRANSEGSHLHFGHCSLPEMYLVHRRFRVTSGMLVDLFIFA